MPDKKTAKQKWIPVFIVAALIAMGVTIHQYTERLNRMVANTNIVNMKELSRHDSKTIENYIDNVWKELEAIVKRLSLYDCKTVEDIQVRMNLEKTSLDFDEIYLLSEDGKIYTAAYMISDADEEVLQCFEENPDRFVHRISGQFAAHTESKKEALLFGVGIGKLRIGDVTFVGMVAQSKIDSIQNSLKIDSYEGRGYSSVIDYDGNYIVNINRVSSLTGLGMAISYLLMKQMDGDIRVESKPGQGSTFTIEFPAETTDEVPSLKNAEIIARDSDSPIGQLNILLAEDNELNAEILIEILKLQGFSLTHAADGKEAVETFERSDMGEYDVILMDVQMPVMDGYEAARRIRGMDRTDAQEIPIFACTANAFKEDQERAMESGMDDFLTKPIDVQLLLKKMNEIIKKGG